MRHKELPVDSVKIPETRVTSYFDSEVYEQFKKTVATMGVLEPIVVVEVKGEYFLVDGLHRLIEAKNTGAARISAVIIPGEEMDVLVTNLFLNVLRGKPRISELRKVVEALYQEYQMGVDKIAEKTGLTIRFIDDLLLISKLPDQIQEAFDEGKLEKGKALALVKCPDEQTQIYIFEALHGKRLTVADWEGYIKALLEERASKTPAPPPEPAAPPPLPHCDICSQEVDQRWLQFVAMCPECLGTAKMSWQQAASQASKVEAAGQTGVGG